MAHLHALLYPKAEAHLYIYNKACFDPHTHLEAHGFPVIRQLIYGSRAAIQLLLAAHLKEAWMCGSSKQVQVKESSSRTILS